MARSRLRSGRAWFRRHWRGLVAVVLALVVVAGGGFALYFSFPHHARSGSVASVRENPAVSVSRLDRGGYRLAPAGNDSGVSRVGLVFYPGGRVAPDAYLASLAPLVERANVTVFVVHPTLNLAVFDQGAAASVIDAHPEIDRWYVGGHSLGGVMACRYAANNPDDLDGVVLFASYCDRSLRGTGLDALSVTGSDDTVLNRNDYRKNRKHLPRDAVEVELRGTNHSEFGDYAGQSGDRPASVGYEIAHRRLANATVPWFRNRTARSRGSEIARHGRATSAGRPLRRSIRRRSEAAVATPLTRRVGD